MVKLAKALPSDGRDFVGSSPTSRTKIGQKIGQIYAPVAQLEAGKGLRSLVVWVRIPSGVPCPRSPIGRRRFSQKEVSVSSNLTGGTKFVRRPFSGLQGNEFGKAVAKDRNHWLLLVNANSSEGSFDSITEVPYNV